MKKFITILLTVAILGLFSCAPQTVQPSDTPDDSSLSVYAGLVDLLRDELEELRRDQSLAAAEYEARIRELEARIAELTGSADTEKEPNEAEPAPEAELPLTYTEKDGRITVTGLKKDVEILVIPEKIDGKPVVAIADSAFSGSSLTGVSIPSGVESIGWFAFFGCVSLTSISLPDTLTSVGYDAFSSCPKLTIYCPAGSYAEKYAVSYGYSVVNA